MLELHGLERNGLAALVAPVALLLERLEGIEIILDVPEDAPRAVLAQELARSSHLSTSEATYLLIQVCAGLSVFRYRVGCAYCQNLWNPLDESLRHYLHRFQAVVYWYDGSPYPAPYATVRWLQELRC